MKKSDSPKLILAGAGPGDKDLISLKAIKALQQADVVLYDALINQEILNYATNATLIYVAKEVDNIAILKMKLTHLLFNTHLTMVL